MYATLNSAILGELLEKDKLTLTLRGGVLPVGSVLGCSFPLDPIRI